jgi:hypothetical protein
MIDNIKMILATQEALREAGLWVNTATATAIAKALMEKGVSVATDNNVGSKWIPVSEQLPEQYESVIVWTSDREIGEAEYDGKQFYWTSDENYTNATHWMPLPEPPKEERQ